VGQWKTVKEEQSMLPSADSDTALRQVASAMKEKSHQRHPHGDVNSSSPPLSPKARASSPPRWRFVADAKKSCGYSSKSAGNVVLGLSADELAAKYTPPDVGSMARNIEQRQIGRLDIREHQESDDDYEQGVRVRSFKHSCYETSGSIGKRHEVNDDLGAHESSITPVCNDETDEESQAPTNYNVYETINQLCCVEEQKSQNGTVCEVQEDFSTKADSVEICNESPESVYSNSTSNSLTNDQRAPKPCSEEKFCVPTKMGKRVAITILLLSFLVISIVLGVVLSQNQDALR
jgi:hypothetical protein